MVVPMEDDPGHGILSDKANSPRRALSITALTESGHPRRSANATKENHTCVGGHAFHMPALTPISWYRINTGLGDTQNLVWCCEAEIRSPLFILREPAKCY